jgi:hypothetical protein
MTTDSLASLTREQAVAAAEAAWARAKAATVAKAFSGELDRRIAEHVGEKIASAEAQLLGDLGPAIGGPLTDLRQRVKALESMPFPVEMVEGAMPEVQNWEATFERDGNRMVKKIALTGSAGDRWTGEVERDPGFNTISKVKFAQVRP